MEENLNTTKITYAKNLNNININTSISVPIDSNVNIKRILDIQTYLYDTKADCGNGKAIINGKIGVKVLYIDTDNLTNNVTENQSFSETYSNQAITSDCVLNISNYTITNSVLSTEGSLKISFEVVINPIEYVNLPLNTNNNFENMIIKKSELDSNTIVKFVNTNFEYTGIFETKENIAKVLCCNTHYTNLNLTSNENYAVAEGKLYATLIYETTENDEIKIKQITDCFNVKTDINLEGISNDYLLDVNFIVDNSKQNISTDIEDDNTIISVLNSVQVVGVCTKNIKLEIVDDLYSNENEIEINQTSRDFTKLVHAHYLEENVVNEISLTNEETAIDEVVANLEMCTEITNTYLKDETLFVEGIVNSNLMFLDENKEYRSKKCETPFIINTKIMLTKLDCTHSTVTIEDCKVKIKRGTIIELEYKLCANICIYEQISKDVVDNIKIGKQLDYSNLDYQIYLSKPNENIWELCKRIKTTHEELLKYNKNLPLELTGKEKIIIKR